MERARFGALQGDRMLGMPCIANVAQEVWAKKEAYVPEEENPAWGDQVDRSLSWEIATAIGMLHSGSDLIVMRHPEAVKRVKAHIDELMQV